MPATTSKEIVQNARALEQKGAPMEVIHQYVSMATQELNALNDRQTNIAGLDAGGQLAGNAINIGTMGLGAPIIDATRRVMGAGLQAGSALSGPVAQAAKGAVSNPMNLMSSGISKPITDATKSATNAYVAADKRYPTENLLPPVTAAIADYFATKAGAKLGFPNPTMTIGNTAGGAAAIPADIARQYISGARGNAPMPESFGAARKKAYEVGERQTVLGLLAGAGVKGVQALAATPLARKGFQKFADFALDKMKSVPGDLWRKTLDKIGDVPIPKVDDIRDFLKNWLEDRGVRKPDVGGGLSPAQQENFADAVKKGLMTQEEVDAFAQQAGMRGVEGEIKKIGKKLGDNLQSDYKTPDVGYYKKFGHVLDDLSLPNMTYKALKTIQKAVGDLAKFGEENRGVREKMMGLVYKKIGDRLRDGADAAGVLKAHKFLVDEGSKFYQSQLFRDILEKSRVFGENAPTLSYKDVASRLKGFSEDELNMLFGKNADYIRTMRDLGASHAKSFPNSPQVYGAVGGTGNPVFRVRPGAFIFRHPNVADYTGRILNRNLGAEGPGLSRTALPYSLTPAEQSLVRAPVRLAAGEPIPYPFNEKKRK